MPARIVQLANDVVAKIIEADIDGAPEPVRVMVSKLDLATTKVAIDVTEADDRTYQRETRVSWSESPTIDVIIYCKAPAGRGVSAESDKAAEFAEAIVDAFEGVQKLGEFTLQGAPSFSRLDRDWAVDFGVVGYVVSLSFIWS